MNLKVVNHLQGEVTSMTRIRRLICFGLLLALLAGPLAFAAPSAEMPAEAEENNIIIEDAHLATMLAAARDGSPEALAEGAQAELARNQEEALATSFFEISEAPLEVAVAVANYLITTGVIEVDGEPVQLRIVASSKNLRAGPDREHERVGSLPHGTIVTFLGRSENGWMKVTDGEIAGWAPGIHLAPFDGTLPPRWTDDVPTGVAPPIPNAPPLENNHDDLFWLAVTIQLEAGSEWLSDEHQLMVGNVVLNRVNHPRFPNTIFDVIHQPGQYCWVMRGVNVESVIISERAWRNAQLLMDGYRVAPPNVVFQAEFTQGDGTFAYFRCDVLNNTTYFGYLGSLFVD